MEKYKELIEAAVHYWANHFTSPTYSDKANGGQLDDMASILMTLAKATSNKGVRIDPQNVQKFKDITTAYLQKQAEKGWDCTLDTDWAPEYPLSHFLRKAELPNTYFPSQIVMWVKFKEGIVKVGDMQIYPVVKKR